MTLTDLEFWPGDFELLVGYHSELSDKISELANRILREKLEKAPLVNSEWWNTESRIQESGWYRGAGTKRSTHTARLVCIEEMKK